jgi:hypothetical protein
VVDKIVVRFEDAVRQPVVTQELPEVFDRIELGTFRRQSLMMMFGGTTSPVDRCQPA